MTYYEVASMSICSYSEGVAGLTEEKKMDNDSCGARIVHLDKVNKAKARDLDDPEVERMSQLFKAFSDPGRLRILHALTHEEMCVCDLAALLNVSESAASHQLRLLRNTGLVTNRRDGSVLYYRPADMKLMELIGYSRSLLETSS